MSAQPSSDHTAPRPGRAGFVMVTLAAASWGTWSLFLRSSRLPALVTTPIIFVIMGLVALPFALRGPRTVWDRRAVALVIANAVLDALNCVAFFGAIQLTTVAIAVLCHYLAPILIALAAPRIDRVDSPGARPAAAVALLGVGSALCYAGNVFVVRRIAARIGPVRAQSYHSLLAGLLMAPLLIGHTGAITGTGLTLLIAGATTIGSAAGVVFSLGLLRIGSARTAVLTFIEPIVAVLIGAVVWGEALHPIAMVGGALVLGAGLQVARKAR